MFNFDFRSDFLTGGFLQHNNEDITNPNNQLLYLPSQAFDVEIKPTLKIDSTHYNLKVVLIPRLQFHSARYNFGSVNESQRLADYGFWEAYTHWELIKNVNLSVGIINSQWGPSDILSPSQFLFSDLLIKLEPFQSTQGVEMAVVQWTPNQNFTLTGMGELDPFGWEHTDTPPYRDRTSKKRVLLRGEFATGSGDFNLGLVLGRKHTDRERAQAGSYAMWNYTNFTQIYYDIGLQQGSERLYIDDTGTLLPAYADDSTAFQVSLVGHRFTFVNGIEWRIEYLHNDFGPSKEQRQRTYRLIHATPLATQYLSILNDSVSPLPGQEFIYNSFRWDNPPFLEAVFSNSHIYLRNIFSLTDPSQLFNFAIETSLTDQLSHSIAFIATSGDNESELSSYMHSYASYFLKFSF
ncbi:MAG TPA: hypothetical protein VIG33_03850 [Pseudobdellovibrionaceae bacterium]